MIDAVIAWVDGSDPLIAEKRLRYTIGTDIEKRKDIGGATRFASRGEINWCVRSIERYAPWIRKIYIVTDGQDPGVKTERIPVEIVDHKVIFQGYEEFLPTFNSLSIETMLWRIPGLSDTFLYFNDDFILINPTHPEDFFDSEDRPIVYGYVHSVMTARIGRLWEFIKKPRHQKVMFRDSMMNAALLLGKNSFFRLQHVPHAIRRDVLERYFREHPDALAINLRHKFRHLEQFNPQELQYLLCSREVRNHKPELVYVESRHPEIIDKPDAKFFCVNSLDQFDAENSRKVIDFIESRLN